MRASQSSEEAPYLAGDSEWSVYTSDMQSQVGFISSWRSIISDVYRCRFLMWQLFKKDFKTQYQQSYLGILWSVILPLVPVVIYVFMAKIGVLRATGIGVPYLVYVVVGLTVWKIFADGISVAISKVVESKSMLGKVRIPKIVIIFSGMGQVLFETGVRIALVAVVAWYYQVAPSTWAFGLALIMVPIFSLTLAAGMLASVINIVIRDVGKLMTVALNYAMFICSVIFPMPHTGVIGVVNQFNPMNTFVNSVRELLFLGPPANPLLLLVTSAACIVLLLIAGRVFHILEHVIHDKL